MSNSDVQQLILPRGIVAIGAQLAGGVPGSLDTRFKGTEVERG